VRSQSSWSIAGAHYKHWATSLGNFGVTPFFGGNFDTRARSSRLVEKRILQSERLAAENKTHTRLRCCIQYTNWPCNADGKSRRIQAQFEQDTNHSRITADQEIQETLGHNLTSNFPPHGALKAAPKLKGLVKRKYTYIAFHTTRTFSHTCSWIHLFTDTYINTHLHT